MAAVAQVAADSSLAQEFRRLAPWWGVTFRKDGDDPPEGFERVDTKGDFSGRTLYRRPEVMVEAEALPSPENFTDLMAKKRREGFVRIYPFGDSSGKNQNLWFYRDKVSVPGIPFAKDERFRVRVEYSQGAPPDSQSKRFKHQRFEVFFPEGTTVTMVEHQGVGFEPLASIEARAKAEGWETAPELQGYGWTLFFRSEAHPHGWVPIQEKLVTDTEEKHAAPPVEVVSVIPVAVAEPVPPIHSEPDDSCGAPKRDGEPCRNPKNCPIAAHVAWHQSKNNNNAAEDGGGKGTLMSTQDAADDTGGNRNDAKIVDAIASLAKETRKGFKKARKAGAQESAEATRVRQEILTAAVNNANRQPVPQRHWAAGPAWALVGVLAMIALAVLFYQLLKDDEPSTPVEDIVAAQMTPIQVELTGIADNIEQLMLDHDLIASLQDAHGVQMDYVIDVLTQYGVDIAAIREWMAAEDTFSNTGDCNVFIGVNVDGAVLQNVHTTAPWGFTQCTLAGGDNSVGGSSPTTTSGGGCNCGGGPAATTTTQPAGTTTTSQPPGATTTTTPAVTTYDPTAVARATNADVSGNVYVSETTGKATICVSGSTSHDNDEAGASIVSYQWVSSQGLSSSDSDEVSACFETSHADAYYTFTLTVTDDEGQVDTDTVTVHVPGPTEP